MVVLLCNGIAKKWSSLFEDIIDTIFNKENNILKMGILNNNDLSCPLY